MCKLLFLYLLVSVTLGYCEATGSNDFTVSNVANSVKEPEVTVPVQTRRQIQKNAINQDIMVKKHNFKRAGIMSARMTPVGNADVIRVPPEACFANFRWDNCGLPAQPVFYYDKPGSRCEVGYWRGCRPNTNMFPNEYECVNTCIYTVRAKPDDFDNILSDDDDDRDDDGDNDGDNEKLLVAKPDSGSEDDTEEQGILGLDFRDLSILCTGEYHYEPTVGSCYRLSKETATWDEAAAACRADDAHLIVINSETERQVVHRLLLEANTNAYIHAGFRAEVPVGNAPAVFKTVFNETLEEAGFAVWSRGEPNNHINHKEYCGSIYKVEGKLNDITCANKKMFICKKD